MTSPNSPTTTTPHCADRSTPSKFNFALSVLILLGILASYLPQHYRIIARRSSEGLSPYFVLLGATSGACAFANVLTLPASRKDLACCRELSGFACAAGLLGIAQVGVQWACFTVILFLFLLFFPRATPLAPPAKPTTRPGYRTAITVFLLCIIHLLLTFLISIFLLYLSPQHLVSWAGFNGIFGAILAAIQYLPQIWTTWKLQAIGSLSIPMMCIQTPGSFVWVGSLAGRFGWEGWSIWGVFLVSGVLQGWLLGMAVVFEMREWRKRKEVGGGEGGGGNAHVGGEGDGGDDDERTALLRHER
ncbi:hypothetical protein ACLMJK_003608 [Lecanora helva]